MAAATKFYATRDFNDAGTEKAFKKDAQVRASAGEIANYVAAGLVTDKEPKTPATEGDAA